MSTLRLTPYYPDNTESEGEEDKGLRGNFSASKPELEPEPKPRPQATCPKCGTTGGAFHMKIHITNCEGTD